MTIDTTYLDSDTDLIKLARPAIKSMADLLNTITSPVGAGSVGYSPSGGTTTTVQDQLDDLLLYSTRQVINVDNAPFYGNLVAAWNSIPSTGNAVLNLGIATYSAAGISTNTKPNVVLQGAKVPQYDSVTKRLIDGSGTVIQGAIYNQAKGFGVFNLGLDYGDWVRSNIMSGQYGDVFSNINVGENADIRYGDLIILASDVVGGNPSSNTHCILNQSGSGFKQTGIVEVIGGYHGHVIKVSNFTADTTFCRYQTADGLIVKSDASSTTGRVNIEKVVINGDNTRPSSGILLEAQSTSLDSVHFGEIIALNSTYVIAEAAATTQPITDVSIGSIYGVAISGDAGGINQAISIGSHSIGYTIGTHALNYCTKGGISVESGAVIVDIGSGYSKNSSTGNGYTFSSSAKHGQLYSIENAGWGVLNTSNLLLNAKDITCTQNTLGGISQVTSLSVTLANSWVDSAGTFRAVRYGSEVRVSGILTGGTGGSGHVWTKVGQLPNYFPVFDEYFACTGFAASGSTVPLLCKVTSTGELQVYDIAGQSATGIAISGAYVVQGNVS